MPHSPVFCSSLNMKYPSAEYVASLSSDKYIVLILPSSVGNEEVRRFDLMLKLNVICSSFPSSVGIVEVNP